MPDYDEPDESDAPYDDELEHSRRSPIAYAKDRVRVPAIIMLVFAIISLVQLPFGIINFFTIPQMMQQQRDQIDRNPAMPDHQKKQMKDLFDTYEKILMVSLPITLFLHLIGGIVSIIGSLKMLKMRSYGWAMTTAVVNIVSIGHSCCFLTLPIGIWALIVLMDSRVKDGYAAAALRQQSGGRDSNANDEYDSYQN